MGHSRLGRLPTARKWREVVALLDGGSDIPQIALSTLTASQAALTHAMGIDKTVSEGLADAANDSGLVHSFWLLTQITQAARSTDFVGALRGMGLTVPDAPKLFDITAAFANAVQSHMQDQRHSTDIGEMTRMAATESLTVLCLETAPSLYQSDPTDIKRALRQFSTPHGFSRLAEECFARLTSRYLLYHLSRELSAHVGPGKRFANLRERSEFNDALDTHCRQVTRIVREFAQGWYSKGNFKGGITQTKARGFSHIALKKIHAEMQRR